MKSDVAMPPISKPRKKESVVSPNLGKAPELLAPAGDRAAALAALHYGADAIYLGLEKFSARAEATNFSAEQLGEIVVYAHALTPRRRVFATVNTVVLERERAELLTTLDALEQAGADAVIVQDLGVARIVRKWFPRLTLHASTQLAVHNLAGAEALKELGFRRVTLARELMLDEIRDISAQAGIETEVFLHGALCYCYSGLCLYSSLLRGRSGNRGRCAYPCREAFQAISDQPSAISQRQDVGFVFSMKDLALPKHVEALRAAGVGSLKIEGRKKSALYVGATVDFYRRVLDGQLPAGEHAARQADLQTIFARPWTSLYADGHGRRAVVDRELVGHRGTPIGRVEAVVAYGGGQARLRFHTQRSLERHDGLQIDIPGGGKPFGFPIDVLRIGGKNVITAPTGSAIEVELPRERPQIPLGAALYCSSSQAVKRSYPFPRPKPGACKIRHPISIVCTLALDKILARASRAPPPAEPHVAAHPEGSPYQIYSEIPAALSPAKDAARMEVAARGAFEKLGDTAFELADFTLENPQGLFAPVSLLNELRRKLCDELGQTFAKQTTERLQRIGVEMASEPSASSKGIAEERWLIKVDRPVYLEAFTADDWRVVEEVSIAVEVEPLPQLLVALERLAGVIGRERIRLALPIITRCWEEKDLLQRIYALREAGWQKWEAANISAWSFLKIPQAICGRDFQVPRAGAVASAHNTDFDLVTDWPLYTLNTSAAAQLFEMGATRVTLSPEDGLDNICQLLPRLGDRATVIVYQDAPLFISESCPEATRTGGCVGPSQCRFSQMELVSDAGEHVISVNRRCRTYTLNRHPFCLSMRLAALRQAGARRLRADFIYRPYTTAEVCRIWREVRAGRTVSGAHIGNFDRGLL
ncbi:MAG: U32 family peptidase [Verrucomicrobia bacterium]|nr:MAG: U32 family peptidase [Verrucomicrobiota bacterium]